MTHPEQIMQAVAVLVKDRGRTTFSRQDVRDVAGVDPDVWNRSYNPTFQGMRADQPGAAPLPAARFQGVFEQVVRGTYHLTDRGWALVNHMTTPSAGKEGQVQTSRERIQGKLAAIEDALDATRGRVPSDLLPSREEFLRGCEAFVENERRDSMYKVATFVVNHFWGSPSDMADGLGVLLLTWNGAFYRYGPFDFDELERCIAKHYAAIDEFRKRDVSSLRAEDYAGIVRLFGGFYEALCIASGKKKGVRSPVATAKALHLLAPSFFPIWDGAIAKACGCPPGRDPAATYFQFCMLSKAVAAHVNDFAPRGQKSLLKRIDEYEYAKYTKKWI